jgi:hypothetical protein
MTRLHKLQSFELHENVKNWKEALTTSYTVFGLTGWGKQVKPPDNWASTLSEIQIWYVMNTDSDCHCHGNLFGQMVN